LSNLEQKDWDEVFTLAEAGDKVRRDEVAEIALVKELTQLQYVPAVWRAGEEPGKEGEEDEAEVEMLDDDGEETPKEKRLEPLREAHFLGYTYSPVVKHSTKVGHLNPEWVRRFFKGFYVNLIMLEPFRWWPAVIGNACAHDDEVPSALLVPGIPVFYQQFDWEQCLIMGVASSLHYCGLVKGPWSYASWPGSTRIYPRKLS
jgi:hypothetical protein